MTATYITTTIPYVNARPHIGHALELVLARHRRGRGEAARFQAGTDDNSLKNVLAAGAAGVGVRDFVDRNAEAFAALGDALSLTVDDFIRTSRDLGLVGAALDEFDFRRATAAVVAIADEANRFVSRARPWDLGRAGDTAGARLDAVLYLLTRACAALGRELAPFLPDAAARITGQCTPRGGRLGAPSPVFRRLALAS